MLKSVEFKNFKCLRDSTLPLSPCTLIVGPNGSGKTTALQALDWSGTIRGRRIDDLRTRGVKADAAIQVRLFWLHAPKVVHTTYGVEIGRGIYGPIHRGKSGGPIPPEEPDARTLTGLLTRMRVYALNARAIAAPYPLQPRAELGTDAGNLAVVLDRLRDEHPERFEAINEELGRWLPEFDHVLFETPRDGHRSLQLRTREGHHAIPAVDVSQGTLLALAILTLAYLPDPPPIVGLEEPDRGIHPRLLRDVRDAMYRLAYPSDFGEKRDPVQVIATTHSPYMLDLFRDHPQEIVIADKIGDNVRFQRLSDLPDIEEILQDSHLGDVWYTGILGGVPSDR